MPSRFESAVEQQIRLAQERGDFDDLPGKGKPIPGLDEPDDELWWVKGLVRREGLPTEAMLPTSLRLRKEIETLPARVGPLPTESAVREIVADLNAQIREWIRIPTGPQVVIRPVDVEEALRDWRAARPEPAPAQTTKAAPARPAQKRRLWGRR